MRYGIDEALPGRLTEAAAGADCVEELAGGHVVTQEFAGANAEDPDESEHDEVLSWSLRQES
ncbi:MAG: hypothetical protein ACRDAX_02570 [Propionibacteriaceae bacterium]